MPSENEITEKDAGAEGFSGHVGSVIQTLFGPDEQWVGGIQAYANYWDSEDLLVGTIGRKHILTVPLRFGQECGGWDVFSADFIHDMFPKHRWSTNPLVWVLELI